MDHKSEGSRFQFESEEQIEVSVLQGRTVILPQSVAIELALKTCVNYAAERSNLDISSVDINNPNENRHETDGFHMFLALAEDLGVNPELTRSAINKSLKPDAFELHTSIARERIGSDVTHSGLSNSYDIICGRYRRAARNYVNELEVEADSKLVLAVQGGDQKSFDHVFNRNGDAILNDLIRHGHEAPVEIIELAEDAVRELVMASNSRELAAAGLDQKVQDTVRDLIFENIPLYRAKKEKEERELATRLAVTQLDIGAYLGRLIGFEDEVERKTNDFIDSPHSDLDKQKVAQVVRACLEHFRARANYEINPPVETLHRIKNPDKQVKRYREIRNELNGLFRKHVVSSVSMKQVGLELFDITDVYDYTDQGHSRLWSRLLNQIIDAA